MMSKFKFGFYSEKEYCVFKEYRPIKKQHLFHSEEHFVVPWQLHHDEEKYTTKAKAWE